MAFDFRPKHVDFVATTGGSNKQRDQRVTFSSAVRRAEVVIKSFDMGYTSEDHHVWREKIQITNIQPIGSSVSFDVEYLFRDSSGNVDDRYSGSVDVVVMAEVA